MPYFRSVFALVVAILLLFTLSETGLNKSEKKPFYNREAPESFSRQTSQNNFRNSPGDPDTYYSDQLEQLNIRLRPGTEHRPDSSPSPKTAQRCRSIVYQTLMRLPYSHRNQLSELILYYTSDGRRGLSGNSAVILRCLDVTDSELASVLTHEMGHLVDSGFLFGSGNEGSNFYDFDLQLAEDDPSIAFYQISWVSDKKRANGSSDLDFVSLYATTDPFEDFAETYTYYRLHGPEFRQLLQSNAALSKKYEFMKFYVFEGQEFGNPNEEPNMHVNRRYYDVTVLPFALKDFLRGSIN